MSSPRVWTVESLGNFVVDMQLRICDILKEQAKRAPWPNNWPYKDQIFQDNLRHELVRNK